jgi:hypothetical protein
MRIRWVRAVVIGLAAANPCCMIFTGSTDGYRLAQSGSDAGPACASASDCRSEGGTQVCCLVLGGGSSASSACQAQCGGSPTLPSVQFCTSDPECGNASCTMQVCSFGGSTLPLRLCGNVVMCSPVDSGP